VDVQIAFQGGGAKLALLLPVVEALLELEADRNVRLNITRVSGTSAGAIAAVLLAERANILALVESIRGMSKDRSAFDAAIPRASTLGWAGKAKLITNLIAFNKPIANHKAAFKLVEDFLATAGVQRGKRVNQTARPCYLVAANLVSRRPDSAAPDTSIIQALAESAALPFIFRTSGEKFDGGLLENLPVEALLTPESPGNQFGEIVAISFEEPTFVDTPDSMLSLASLLLDAAITHKTRSSRQLIGTDNVFEMPHVFGKNLRVDSFDAESFFKFLNDENAYERAKTRTKAWFLEFFAKKSVEKNTDNKINSGAAIDPSQSDILSAQNRDLRRLAEAFHKQDSLIQTESILEVLAGTLTDDAHAKKMDTVKYIDTFKSPTDPIHIFVTRLFAANAASAKRKDIKIFDSEMRPIPFVAFSVMDEANETLWTLSCFLKPQLGSGDPEATITVLQEQEVADVMLPLRRQGSDYLGVKVNQAREAGLVEIRLCIPSAFGKLKLENGTVEAISELKIGSDPFVQRHEILVEGKQSHAVVVSCPPGFDAYVWQARNCRRDENVRVIYRRDPAT
jgi:predicted acylesterase/phospholipase RssA